MSDLVLVGYTPLARERCEAVGGYVGEQPDAIVGWFGSSLFHSVEHAVESAGKIVVTLSPVNLVRHVLKGERIDKALLNDFKDKLSATKEVVHDAAPYAATVCSMVPGIGTGVAGAIAASAALVDGKPLTEILVAAIKDAVPGGPAARIAFETAMKAASGKNVLMSALESARSEIPPGLQQAYDIGLAVAHGKKLQDIAAEGVKSFVADQLHVNTNIGVAFSVPHIDANALSAAEKLYTAARFGATDKIRKEAQKVIATTYAVAKAGHKDSETALRLLVQAKAKVMAHEPAKKALVDSLHAAKPITGLLVTRKRRGQPAVSVAGKFVRCKKGDPGCIDGAVITHTGAHSFHIRGHFKKVA